MQFPIVLPFLLQYAHFGIVSVLCTFLQFPTVCPGILQNSQYCFVSFRIRLYFLNCLVCGTYIYFLNLYNLDYYLCNWYSFVNLHSDLGNMLLCVWSPRKFGKLSYFQTSLCDRDHCTSDRQAVLHRVARVTTEFANFGDVSTFFHTHSDCDLFPCTSSRVHIL